MFLIFLFAEKVPEDKKNIYFATHSSENLESKHRFRNFSKFIIIFLSYIKEIFFSHRFCQLLQSVVEKYCTVCLPVTLFRLLH